MKTVEDDPIPRGGRYEERRCLPSMMNRRDMNDPGAPPFRIARH